MPADDNSHQTASDLRGGGGVTLNEGGSGHAALSAPPSHAAHAGPMRTGGEPTHPMGAAGGVRNYLHPSQAPVPGTGPAQPAPPPSSASAPVSAEESRKAAGPLQNRPHTTAISPPPPPHIIVPLAALRPPQALGGASRAALLAPQPAVAGPIAPHPNALPQQQMAANSCSSGATQVRGDYWRRR